MASNLFPTEIIQAEEENTSGEVITFGKNPKFDFDKGEFVITPTGQISVAEGVEGWVEWCKKTINTQRYLHPIYPRSHGNETQSLIGRSLSKAAKESELRRMITECLMEDPRTQDVRDFSFIWKEDQCFFTCRVINVRDEPETLNGSVVI